MFWIFMIVLIIMWYLNDIREAGGLKGIWNGRGNYSNKETTLSEEELSKLKEEVKSDLYKELYGKLSEDLEGSLLTKLNREDNKIKENKIEDKLETKEEI